MARKPRLSRRAPARLHNRKPRRLLFETFEARIVLASDFGDAPNGYGTLLASNGPRHTVTPGVFLGANVDAEADGQPSAAATGDDTNGGTTNPPGDEQGVDFDQPLQPGGVTSVEVSANIPGYLHAWIDFNADGDFTDAGERIAGPGALGFPIPVHGIVAGPQRIMFQVPSNAVVGTTFARFRFTTNPGDLAPTGILAGGIVPDGEVEDHRVQIVTPIDFGDAPDSYGTKLASGGARHTISGPLHLGTHVDPEPDAPPRPSMIDPLTNITSDDDDEEAVSPVFIDDEDGVSFVNGVTAGRTSETTIVASAAGRLDAWVDFNRDGDFLDPGEKIFNNLAIASGTSTLHFAVPSIAVPGASWARFRISTAGNLGPTGIAADGEVEDYDLYIDPGTDYGDAPAPYPVASHDIVPGFHLGVLVDPESATQVFDVNALGDDRTALDDEDGISTPRTLSPGSQDIDIVASAAGYVNAWIDFNADGDWNDAGEQIFTDQLVNPGVNALSFTVPAAAAAKTFGRFRLSQATGTGHTGFVVNGEVEDYEFAIGPQDFGDAPDSYRTLEAALGPAHVIVDVNPFMGSAPTSESDGQPSDDAALDENDDGLFHDSAATQPLGVGIPLIGGANTLWVDATLSPAVDTLEVPAGVMMAPPTLVPIAGYLNAWIDFNHDGNFDPQEQIAVNLPVASGTVSPVPFNVPANAVFGQTFARFRLSSEQDLLPIGLAADGEVEDYEVVLTAQAEDFGDAPNTYPTLLAQNGPRHLIPVVQSTVLLAGTTNGGFESGLAGWTIGGNAGRVEVLTASNFSPAINPPGPTHFALLSTGPGGISGVAQGDLDANLDPDFDVSSLTTSFTVTAAQVPAVLSFDWNLLTREVGVDDDFFHVFLNGTRILERSVRDTTTSFSPYADTFSYDHIPYTVDSPGTTDGSFFLQGQSGFRTFQQLVTTPGTYTLKFEIADATDNIFDSGLLIDNVQVVAQPEFPDPLRLGDTIDADPDGQPRADSLGDDLDADGDDEDGVEFIGNIIPGNPFGDVEVTANIPAGGTGFLDAWVDYNADGDFDDLGEHVCVSAPLTNGENRPAFDDVPATAVTGLTHVRFRLSSTGGLTPRGAAADGEVEDYLVLIGDRSLLLDYGDAPYDLTTVTTADNYPTRLAQNGARHQFDPNVVLFLGSGLDLDHETDGQPNATATGDDIALSDDEDGVAFPLTALVPGDSVDVTVTANAPGRLDAWIDWNADGDWSDAGEQIAAAILLAGGENLLTIAVPGTAVIGNTFARFRFSDAGGLAPTGLWSNGEVEDYRVAVSNLDFGDAPDNAANANDYPTVLPLGASHVMNVPGPILGDLVDAELDGRPSALADGDDVLDASDDEDGVTFLTPFIPGDTISFDVENTGAAGVLDVWFDVNGDGDWNDAFLAEHVITAAPLPVGTTTFTFMLQFGARIGPTFMRLRATTAGIATPGGPAPNGEMEDYRVVVQAADFGDAPDEFYSTRLPPVGDGPRHALVANPTVFLGAAVDADIDGQSDNLAVGDDHDPDGDDEDGVALPAVLLTGSTVTIPIDYTHATADGLLNAWIDFNGNGVFDHPAEQIADDVELTAGETFLLEVEVPPDAVVGDSFARFRVSTDEGLTPLGPAFDGEVEDYLIPIEYGLDFGDAPEPDYSTLLNPVTGGGPRHRITGLYLGESIDQEANGQPHVWALGDDLAGGDDEDGVVFLTPLVPGGMASILVTASTGGGFLNGWFDFRGDDDWDDPGEHPAALTDVPLAAGPNVIAFPVPVWATPGLLTYARFRLSTATYVGDSLGPDGILPTVPEPTVPDGEVEDYPIVLGLVSDWGDAPDGELPLGTPEYPTLAVNGGASHAIVSGVFLGQVIDSEADGQPTAGATGDDAAGVDDEDGAVFSQMIPGGQSTLTVTASSAGYVSAWVDFNRDGDWDDANEWIAAIQPVTVGANQLLFNVPPNAIVSSGASPLTFARVRFETVGTILDPDGAAANGEVEDNAVTVGALPELSVSDVTVTEPDNSQTVIATFTVTLAVPYSSPVTVNYTTADGTAQVAGGDYVPTSGQLTFAPGETTKTVNVTVNGDISDELSEAFSIVLSNPVNAALGDAQGTGTIADNDTATVAYTIVLRDPSLAGNPEFGRDTNGNYRIPAGASFIAEVFVDDLRSVGSAGGVFSAFADLAYSPNVVNWTAGSLTFGSQFGASQAGTINEPSQLVDEAGGAIPAFPPPAPVGANPAQLLFRVAGQVAAGTLDGTPFTLALDAADALGHPTQVFGINGEVPASYESETVVVGVARPWQNPANPCDVNNDGRVDLLDEGVVVNAFNNGGQRMLPNPPVPPNHPNPTPGIPGTAMFVDLDGDGFLTTADVQAIFLCPKDPIVLAADAPPPAGAAQSLTADDLAPIVSAAVEQWTSAGISADQAAALSNVQFQIADLDGNLLGLAQGFIILIDQDAAGHGWFVDPTPAADEEFADDRGRLAAIDALLADRVDLLTVVAHELGHLLGMDDTAQSEDELMFESLQPGERRKAQLKAVDAVFGGGS